jgi:glycosyltransferase 2 family protein
LLAMMAEPDSRAALDAAEPSREAGDPTREPGDTAAPPPEARVSSGRRLLWQLGLGLAIAGFFVWVMRAGAMPLVPHAEAFAAMRWWTVGAYFIGWSIVHVLRAARWQLLLAPIAKVPLRRVFSASWLGFLAILILPLRAGEVVRPMMVREQGRLSAWAAAGTLGAERIADGLVLSAMLFVALALSTPLDPLPDRLGDLPISVSIIPRAAYAALILFTVAFVVMLAFYRWKRAARRLVQLVVGGISPRLASWISRRVEHLAEGLSFMSLWRLSVPFALMTVAYWLLNVACTWLLCWGTGFEGFTYGQASVVTGVLALGVLMPNAPGFFGAYQFSLYAGLAVFYPRELVLDRGAAFVLTMYVLQTLITVVFALWGMWLGRRRPAPLAAASSAPVRAG